MEVKENVTEGMEAGDMPSLIMPWLLKRGERIVGREEFKGRLYRGSRRPNITPDRFNGKILRKDDQEHFEVCQLANNWTDKQAAVFLAAGLQGPTLKVLIFIRMVQERNIPTRSWSAC